MGKSSDAQYVEEGSDAQWKKVLMLNGSRF
jgi:hypothetical protein